MATGFHSASEANPWWSIDLQKSYFVQRIHVKIRIVFGVIPMTHRFKDVKVRFYALLSNLL